MEKVNITYERYTEKELLENWKKDDLEWKTFLEETGLTEEEIDKTIKEDNTIQYLNKIIEYAKECDLYFCSQCCHFVDINAYIHTTEQCIECTIGNRL